ncbi:UDP-N-acetylmuramate dehydrogenase [Ligilactobacillus agilis]|uniref:UDP-N-acetylenolpyruvoylglucosamine reductase n=2 Tax=Ligilactobacillus agilis TaxID=1601 RepID=A0A0R2ARY9_9LACO|nr:UDP-N-acetylmuramate dehydrogenase [Ligilactobacillus agilis]ASR41264.1 UDP-N-acetylenolpyruvoylglucosamine reductase [Ligilactobacillus agilis]KRM65884.1 UDP-N-acetylenolpyruvoylglucosamine reductase [Ligilactobacillus agilis DSM 20509]MBL1055912.1 UDP-N-acetylmuramate dehydrogenase [Ligilactobacillus agilis]MBM6763776.1 UDP-N-acetylmuramate dehydrogenase [Ligilactobacillus agilis]MBM6772742.1 UDP-N-acetylmuramate dehydrogenase [Ligilactobacillus agilis]
MTELAQEFKVKFPKIKILAAEPLAKYTNTKTGGPAECLAFPKNVAEIKSLLVFAKENQVAVTVIGNASNLIVKEGGILGLVIILTDMNEIKVEGNFILAQAGASLIKTTQVAYQAGLTGLEFAAGIPGSIGGAIFMNAGAYDGEIKDVVKSVEVITRDGQLKTYQNNELHFAYRHSRLQEEDDIVLQATFSLRAGDRYAIRNRMEELNFLRASKQPLEYPSCGSVFKRPVGHFTGKLICDAGLQGYQSGGAQVSKKHAGFIVNVDHATASDYLDVIHHIQAEIKAKFDVDLETEVRIIGRDS